MSNLASASPLFNFSGQTAIVTGASSGLGVQFATALAKQGANLVLAARRQDKLDQVATTLRQLGVEVLTVPTDVTDETQVKNLVDQAVAKFGQVHILVNNAGVSAISPAEQMSQEDWDKVLNVNLKGVFLVAKHIGQHFLAKGYGRLVNIASIYGVVGNTAFGVVNYHAAKSGVVGLTKALAGEWANKGDICVNAIGPGFFESEMTAASIADPNFKAYVEGGCPKRRIGKAGELDTTLLLLAAKESSYLTGQIICVDGGWTAV